MGRMCLLKWITFFRLVLKDRGASLLVSYAREHQVSSLVEDSSGNAGCSIAAYSARAGISCEIFVPDHTSVGKLRQIEAYGSKVRLVEGSRRCIKKDSRAN